MSQYSRRFNFPDADIVVNSADGMTFGVHRNRLAAHSIIFETAENFVTSGEPVRLSDTAATLELFFGCIYNQPVDPEELEIDEVLLLADTALKYESRLIFQLCKPEIRSAIPAYPFKILNWAMKNWDMELVDLAAEATLGQPAEAIPDDFDSISPSAWIRYYMRWQNLATFVRRVPLDTSPHDWHTCERNRIHCSVQARIAGTPNVLLDLDNIFEEGQLILQRNLYPCFKCRSMLDEWHRAAQQERDKIPKFSKFGARAV